MVLKGFPNVITQGQQYKFGVKLTAILYTDINHHVETPKQNQRLPGMSLRVQIYRLRVLEYSEMVVEFKCEVYMD